MNDILCGVDGRNFKLQTVAREVDKDICSGCAGDPTCSDLCVQLGDCEPLSVIPFQKGFTNIWVEVPHVTV